MSHLQKKKPHISLKLLAPSDKQKLRSCLEARKTQQVLTSILQNLTAERTEGSRSISYAKSFISPNVDFLNCGVLLQASV